VTRTLSIAAFLSMAASVPPSFGLEMQPAMNSATAGADFANSYPDTEDGLRQLLTACLNAAKDGDKAQLSKAIHQMEIPDYQRWFQKVWPTLYTGMYGKDLKDKQAVMTNMISYLAHQPGVLVIHKVGDGEQAWPKPTEDVDIYEASWRQESATAPDAEKMPIGYFFYFAGGFRWNSLAQNANRPVYRTEAVYPYPSDVEHPAGTVLLRFKVREDGSVSTEDFAVVQINQYSADPLLVQAAVAALKQWRYRPADLYVNADEMPMEAEIDVKPPAASPSAR